MYWYGIMMRCGEQLAQTTLPHFLVREGRLAAGNLSEAEVEVPRRHTCSGVS